MALNLDFIKDIDARRQVSQLQFTDEELIAHLSYRWDHCPPATAKGFIAEILELRIRDREKMELLEQAREILVGLRPQLVAIEHKRALVYAAKKRSYRLKMLRNSA